MKRTSIEPRLPALPSRGPERRVNPNARSADVSLAELAVGLSAGFDRPDARALVALALDFWTWQRLDLEGLDDAAAAELMTATVAG
jgi:hypothetical protein